MSKLNPPFRNLSLNPADGGEALGVAAADPSRSKSLSATFSARQPLLQQLLDNPGTNASGTNAPRWSALRQKLPLAGSKSNFRFSTRKSRHVRNVPNSKVDAAIRLHRQPSRVSYRFVGVIFATKPPKGLYDCLARSPYSAPIFCDSVTNVS